jgi:hypothetical protein
VVKVEIELVLIVFEVCDGIFSTNLITKLSKPIYVGGSFNISFSNKIVTFCLDNSIRKLFYE